MMPVAKRSQESCDPFWVTDESSNSTTNAWHIIIQKNCNLPSLQAVVFVVIIIIIANVSRLVDFTNAFDAQVEDNEYEQKKQKVHTSLSTSFWGWMTSHTSSMYAAGSVWKEVGMVHHGICNAYSIFIKEERLKKGKKKRR